MTLPMHHCQRRGIIVLKLISPNAGNGVPYRRVRRQETGTNDQSGICASRKGLYRSFPYYLGSILRLRKTLRHV